MHGVCGGDVKQRYRDAECWTAVIAGQVRCWTPATRAKGTAKQAIHERLARRMGDQRNLDTCTRKVWDHAGMGYVVRPCQQPTRLKYIGKHLLRRC